MKCFQRGNILFLILLAVVLFAALSYAVTSSMRGGGKNATTETIQAQAADILQYFSQIDTAVLRMNMSQNIRFEDLSFSAYAMSFINGAPTAYVSVYNANSNCTTSACKVFDVNGGGVSPRIFDKYAGAYNTTVPDNSIGAGSMKLWAAPWPGAGTSLADIYYQMPYMKSEICLEINKQLSINDTPVITGSPAQGSTPSSWDSGTGIITSTDVTGKTTFANAPSTNSTGTYCSIYHLVITR